MNYSTWPSNPKYQLKATQRSRIALILMLPETRKDQGVGAYLFKGDVANLDRNNLIGKTPFQLYCGAFFVSCDFFGFLSFADLDFLLFSVAHQYEIGAGDYLLIPATFNPGVLEKFTLKVYCDQPCQLFRKSE